MIENREPTLPPETVNDEQEDEGAQAHEVAAEARDAATGGPGLGDTEKVPSGDDSDDVPDLVDHMIQMDRSGRLDFDAYRGERNDDDEEGLLGDGAED
jgi:hypothetical protein